MTHWLGLLFGIYLTSSLICEVVGMAPKRGGIRKRLQAAEPAEPAEPAEQAEPAEPAEPAASSSSREPRGGLRRRLEKSAGASSQETGDKSLYKTLKKNWALGKISSPLVQEIAEGAEKAGATGLSKTASAGSSGRNPQHLQRALISVFGKPVGAPDFEWFTIPLKSGRLAHPFLLPHLWFASLFAFCPNLFRNAVTGISGSARAFWTLFSETDFVKKHPCLPRPEWDRIIPVGFHGDGGSFSRHDGMYVFTWNSLLGSGTTVSKRFLMTVVKTSEIIAETFPAVLAILAWSFNVLLTGIYPEIGPMGEALVGGGAWLAQGLKGCLNQIRGDWEFQCSINNLPKWSHAENMCWMCKAAAHGLLTFTNFCATAPWRPTRRTHESYVRELRRLGKQLPVLFQIVVGLRLECIMIDVMHTVDQGVASHVFGNVFWLCVSQHCFGGTSLETNIERLNKEINKFYKSFPAISKIQGKLSSERLRSASGYPKLKSKAAATRYLAPFVLQLARKYLSPTVIAVCELLTRFYDLINEESMFLSAAAKHEIPKLGLAFSELYSQLATESFAAGELFWKVTPKHHLFQHLCEWQAISYGNPRFYWVYADEDLVGKLIECARSCHPKTMAFTAMFKWLLLSFDDDL